MDIEAFCRSRNLHRRPSSAHLLQGSRKRPRALPRRRLEKQLLLQPVRPCLWRQLRDAGENVRRADVSRSAANEMDS